jgi:putative tryptophan/tyrosine transport system substrate-binding protein
MKRRKFISLVSASAVAWPIATRAQPTGKVARVGIISPATGRAVGDDAFEESLQQLGWTKNENVIIEFRYTGGRQDTVLPLVTEVLGLGVDVLVTTGPPLSLAAQRASTQIPLVFLITFDPVDLGLVSNIARPGGNVTGVTSAASLDIFAKRLQLLREFLPSLARVAVLVSTEQTRSTRANDTLNTAASSLGIELRDLEIRAPAELEGAIRDAKNGGTQALYVWPSGFTFSFAKQISDIANAHGMPSCHSFREGALAGGLLAYAADLKEMGRGGAAYVDKILRGTQPGMLPVEQLTKYELVINLRTSKALGLTAPPTILATADEVIE